MYKLFDEYINQFDGSSSSSVAPHPYPIIRDNDDDFAMWSRIKNKKNKYSKSISNNELGTYLECDFGFDENIDLDVLNWQSTNSYRYPIVSRKAKDLLTIPTSTVASESGFSTSKRVLNNKRYKLSEKLVEASIYLKDWYDIADRIQNLKLNDKSGEEDETTFMTDTE